VLVDRVARRALALGAAYATACCIGYAIVGGIVADAMAAGDPDLAARATTLIHVSLTFIIADAANVIARGVLRGASDVRYAAVIGIVTAWVTTPPLTWFLGFELGLGAVGGWIGLALEIFVGAVLFWLRVYRGGWKPAAMAARRAMTGTAV
jgi:MATE family multidrug resistance protein